MSPTKDLVEYLTKYFIYDIIHSYDENSKPQQISDGYGFRHHVDGSNRSSYRCLDPKGSSRDV